MTYLNENTNQPINISKIAEHLGLSYHGIAPLIEEMQQEFSALYQVSLCEKGFKVRSLEEPLSCSVNKNSTVLFEAPIAIPDDKSIIIDN